MTTRPANPAVNNWDGVVAVAKACGAKFPELVAAQWALESAWGKEVSGVHNYFGLKGKGSTRTTQEVVNGKTITIDDQFIDFSSIEACIKYLVDRWYKDWNGNRGINRAKTAQEAAKLLIAEGYATDPKYCEKLIKLLTQKPVTAKKLEQAATLFKIEAIQETWLKKSPKPSSDLPDKEKKLIEQGTIYAVSDYDSKPADGHAKVTIEPAGGTWYIFQPHWRRIQKTGEALPATIDWSNFNELVTPNLTVGEILQWDKRRIPGPNSAMRGRLVKTSAAYQQIREAWGAPLGVTSFYRPEPINQEVGGVPGSRHTMGDAFDIYPSGGRSLEAFYQWIRVRWTGGLGDGRHRGFIHLDTRNGGRFVPGAGVRPSVEWTY